MFQLNCVNCGRHSSVQNYGQLTQDQITLERKYVWDIIRTDWKEVFVTFEWTIIIAYIGQNSTQR